jgi:chromosome segregation ATPase
MEVISGMAPRPSTPQRNERYRSMSAPNSPARSQGAGMSGIPGINRLPSQDSLDRSIHNESGHGKSIAQIVRDLKTHNSVLSAKSASMEMKHMNQLSETTKSFADRQKFLEESLGQKDRQITALEAYKVQTDQKLKEKYELFCKVKEEGAFQRHAISDLKNQLHQLQSDMDDQDFEKRESWDQMVLDNQAMARVIEDLQQDADEGMQAKQQVEELRIELDSAKAGIASSADTSSSISKSIPQEEFDKTNSPHQIWQQLEQAQGDLEQHRKRLSATQDNLKHVQVEKDGLAQEHNRRVKELESEFKSSSETWQRDESALLSKIESLESTDGKVTMDMRNQLDEREDDIAQLKDELRKYADQAADFSGELEKVRHDASHQELYRRDEAEDLRILHDAQEEEIGKLRKELDDAQRELELRDQQLEENGDLTIKRRSEVEELKEELKAKVEAEQAALEKLQEYKEIAAEVGDLQDAKAADAIEIESLKTQLVEAQKPVPETSSNEPSVIELEKQTAETASNSEVERLKNEITRMETKVIEADKQIAETREIALVESRDEIQKLRDTVLALETSSAMTVKIKKQLREAQIALVALDDEKKKMAEAHRELVSAVEKKKEELQREVDAKEKDIADLRKNDMTKLAVGKLVRENESLVRELSTHKANNGAQKEDALRRELETAKHEKEEVIATLEKVKKEKETQVTTFRAKLKDRDTTIAALSRSSVTLEEKISTMENDLGDMQSVHDEERSVAGGELHQLQKAVSAFKRSASKASEDIAALQKELFTARADSERWRAVIMDDGNGGGEYLYQISMLQKEAEENVDKLHESDRAIENLVNQSMAQEVHVKDLKTRVSSLMKENEAIRLQKNKFDEATVKVEVGRLQHESEIFAMQIIEQDEEIESLKLNLQVRDEQMFALKRQMSASKASEDQFAALTKEVSDLQVELRAKEVQLKNADSTAQSKDSHLNTKRITDLQAELDELQEASEEKRTELRDLRRQLRDAKEAAGQVGDLKVELDQAKYALEDYMRKSEESLASELRKELDEALAENKALAKRKVQMSEDLESRLRERDQFIEQLKNKTSDLGDHEVAIFQTELANLRLEVTSKAEKLEMADATKRRLKESLEKAEAEKMELERELTERMQNIPTDGGEVDAIEKEDIVKANEALKKVVANLMIELASFNKEHESFEKLKAQLDQEQAARDAAEKSIVETYERQLSRLNLNKDVTIDGLRKDLAESRGRSDEGIQELAEHTKIFEIENSSLREQLEVELQAKNQQIYALEHTLHAQEQLVENMRMEMDQLQGGMESATEKRRGDVEELQQEVIEIETRAMKQEREIMTLKMRVEEGKLDHKAEVVRLKDTIVQLEQESPLAKTVAELQNDDRMLEVRERLEQLKMKNSSLQEENLKLGGRLERAIIEIRSFEAEKEHADALEKDVARLQRTVKKLEEILHSGGPPKIPATSPKPALDKENETVPIDRLVQVVVVKENQPLPQKSKSKSKGNFRLFKRKGKDAPSDEKISVEVSGMAPIEE